MNANGRKKPVPFSLISTNYEHFLNALPQWLKFLPSSQF
jgi:hypothetical protein